MPIYRFQRHRRAPLPSGLLLWALCAAAPTAWSLSTDRDQPIEISADAGQVDETAGVSIYSGNVTIDQGSTSIRADQVEVVVENEEVVRIVARAKPGDSQLAHYEHLPDDASEPVFAEARTITYLVPEARLQLTGEATLQQTRDRFSGNTLVYDVNKGAVDLSSGGSGGDRINMTITPRSASASAAPSSSPATPVTTAPQAADPAPSPDNN